MNKETLHKCIKRSYYVFHCDVIVFDYGEIACDITISSEETYHTSVINYYNQIYRSSYKKEILLIYNKGGFLEFIFTKKTDRKIHSFFTVSRVLNDPSKLTVILNTAAMARETMIMMRHWQYDCRIVYINNFLL